MDESEPSLEAAENGMMYVVRGGKRRRVASVTEIHLWREVERLKECTSIEGLEALLRAFRDTLKAKDDENARLREALALERAMKKAVDVEVVDIYSAWNLLSDDTRDRLYHEELAALGRPVIGVASPEKLKTLAREVVPPAPESARWTPVSEDDPEEDMLVFVANMDASFKSITVGMWNGQRWRTWNGVGIYVTHWMELPFPDWPEADEGAEQE